MGRALQVVAIAAATLLAVSAAALAEPTVPSGPPVGAPGLALTSFPARNGKTLSVYSPAFKPDGDIPLQNTQYGRNVFPGLSWSKGPYGTRSFVVIMQDADVAVRGGLLHWSMYGIPAGVTKLPAGMTEPPAGASFGPNVRGPNQPYMGPHTPRGAKHHYHFEVFALDQTIPADPALSWDALALAIAGHVLASGDLIGLGQDPPPTPVRLETTFKFGAPR